MTDNEKLAFSRKEAAWRLGISLPTLDKSGIPHVRIGNRVIYRRAAIEKYLEEREESCGTKQKG
jgi:excisionase family DNA binding protein